MIHIMVSKLKNFIKNICGIHLILFFFKYVSQFDLQQLWRLAVESEFEAPPFSIPHCQYCSSTDSVQSVVHFRGFFPCWNLDGPFALDIWAILSKFSLFVLSSIILYYLFV
jgi:hypothetical protein